MSLGKAQYRPLSCFQSSYLRKKFFCSKYPVQNLDMMTIYPNTNGFFLMRFSSVFQQGLIYQTEPVSPWSIACDPPATGGSEFLVLSESGNKVWLESAMRCILCTMTIACISCQEERETCQIDIQRVIQRAHSLRSSTNGEMCRKCRETAKTAISWCAREEEKRFKQACYAHLNGTSIRTVWQQN